MELAPDLEFKSFFMYTSSFSQILLAIAISIKQTTFQQCSHRGFFFFSGISGQLEGVNGQGVKYTIDIPFTQNCLLPVMFLEFRSTECKTIMHTVSQQV